jgi:hypothetical protein
MATIADLIAGMLADAGVERVWGVTGTISPLQGRETAGSTRSILPDS